MVIREQQNMMTMLDAALMYAERGFAVFPCSPGSKMPFKGSSGSTDATTDEAQIRAWWDACPTANVAIATGSTSGIYVVDIDAESHPIMARLPQTWIARTRGGGWHYVYRLPEGVRLANSAKETKPVEEREENARNLGDHIDTRGEGGYILVFPSVVGGKPYAWENDIDPVELPGWIVERLKPREVVRSMTRQTFALASTSWAQKALDDECRRMECTGKGGRNDQLNRSAFSLGQIVAAGHLSASVVESRLLYSAGVAGLSDREALTTIASGMKGGSQHPRSPAERAPVAVGREWTLDGETGEVVEAIEVIAPRKQDDGDARRWDLLADVRRLGGLCDSFAAWVLRGADHPQPGLTLASLLALGSVLSARRLVYRRAQASLYVVALAASGEGKNRPQACLARVLDEVWSPLRGPQSFSSAPAFVDIVKTSTINGHGTCWVLDEYGMQLQSMIGHRAAQHRQDLKHYLTELSTKGADKWTPAISLTKGGGKLDLWAPSVTLMASTTPDSLHAVLTSTEVADGFVGRHLWMRAQDVLPEWQPTETRGDDGLPLEVRVGVETIKERSRDWHMGLPVHTEGMSDPIRLYQPIAVNDTPEAARLLVAHKLACDQKRRDGADMEIPRATLAREAEFAGRLALALATLAQPEADSPTIDESTMAVAIRVAQESSATFGASLAAGRKPSWNDHEAQVDYVVGILRDAGGSLRRTDLLRSARRLNARSLEDVVARLIEEEQIMEIKTVGKTKPSIAYRLV